MPMPEQPDGPGGQTISARGDGSFQVEGKRVLITGASSGIGAALAEALAARGATVGICARRAGRLQEVLDRISRYSPSSKAWTVDLADLGSIEAFATRATEELGGIDVLVNNAGIPKRRRVDHLTAREVEEVTAVNYFAPVRLTLALLGELVRQSGRIVNISSVAAHLAPPGEAAYAATKAALTAWSESIQVDLSLSGSRVKVHVVNPGVIDTELFHLPGNDPSVASLEPLPAQAVAEAVISVLQTGDLEIYVPGWFEEIVKSKYQDPSAFLEGTISWARSGDPVPKPKTAATASPSSDRSAQNGGDPKPKTAATLDER